MPSPLLAAVASQAAEGQVQEDIRLVEGRGAGRADEDAAALAVAAVGSRAALAALGHVADQQAVTEADGRRVRGTTDGHGDAAADAVAAVGPAPPAPPWARLPRKEVLVMVAVELFSRARPPPMPSPPASPLAPAPPIALLAATACLLSVETPAVAQDAAADAIATGAAVAWLLLIRAGATFSVPWLEMPPPVARSCCR